MGKSFTLRSFKSKISRYKRSYRRFLTGLKKNPPRGLDRLAAQLEKEVWKEVDCIECANCCKVMTPTYTENDIRRISGFLGMKPEAMKAKWLNKERATRDWVNKTTPCQFLDQKTNLCTIYSVRPADCAGFPHLSKKKMVEYMHVHHQNLESCPATFRLVEKMKSFLEEKHS